jgi:ribosomal protein S6
LPCLKELDLRAAKKQVCKLTPEMADMLKLNECVLRGGIVKKGKKTTKKAKK